MARPAAQPTLARYILPAVLAVAGLLSLLPGPWLAWAGWFGSLAGVVTAPISSPVAQVGRALTAPSRAEDQRTLAELEALFEGERLRRQQAEREAERLRAMLAELTLGARLNPDVVVEQLPAPVVGFAGGMLRVRAGEPQGLERNTIATARGIQLLGRVERVDGPTSLVTLITDRDAVRLTARVMLDETETVSRMCTLAPVGDGTLRGEVEAPGAAETDPLEPAVGMRVRLDDPVWPDAGRMLIIGEIVRVEPHRDQPLRKVITVRPLFDLRRSSEVIFRLPRRLDEGGTP